MTSWSQLEAFLQRLAEKAGGVSYALRDARGVHLVPVFQDLDARKLRGIVALCAYRRKSGKFDDKAEIEKLVKLLALLPDDAPKLRAFIDHVVSFDRALDTIESLLGSDFVKRGPGKRHIHTEPGNMFVAERLLSSYLLIVLFTDDNAPDSVGATWVLEKERAALCDLLQDLPPDDDGDRALASARRPA